MRSLQDASSDYLFKKRIHSNINPTVDTKVILKKSCLEMSPVEQYTNNCECLAYLRAFFSCFGGRSISLFFLKRDFVQLFSADTTIFKKKKKFDRQNMKKASTKVADNRPNFFFQYCQLAQNQPKSHFLFH